MKKIASYLTLFLMAVLFASCSDDFAQPPVSLPEGGLGTGIWNDPYRTSQLANGGRGNNIWITGYIVGWINTAGDNFKMDENTCTFDAKATLSSNILMAVNPDETNWENCVPVALSGDARDALNLQNNPDNLGKQVTVKANNERYFGNNGGIKNITAFKWGDTGIEEEEPVIPEGEIFKATFDGGNTDGFTFIQGTLPEGLSFVWKADNRYGLVATGYYNNTRYETDAWAVSPLLDLSGYKSITLNFRWAGNYFGSQAAMLGTVDFAVREPGGEWTVVGVPVAPSGTDFTYVDSGNVDLSAFAGKKIQLGFNYRSTPSLCGTLEIDNISVTGEK